jgi:hydroxyacylglutathione hydrolase
MTTVHDGAGLRVRVFTGGAFQENTFLLSDPETGDAVAVDPGAATPALLAVVAREGLTLRAAWLTHAHLDHVEGLPALKEAWPEVPVALHPADRPLYDRARDQAHAFGLPLTGPLPEPDLELAPGDTLRLGSAAFGVRFTPGHAPGHVILVSESEGIALVGDVVFQRSIGRTDLPGGDMGTLLRSIRDEVLTLPDETLLFPGHGPPTTVGAERTGNPFLATMRGDSRA